MSTPNELLRKWAYKCPHGEYLPKRRMIINELNINRTIFSNYITGKTAIPWLAVPIIEKIIGVKLTDDGNNTLHE